MSEQLIDETPIVPLEAQTTELQISDDGQIENQNNVIDLTDKNTNVNSEKINTAIIQPEGRPYTYGNEEGDRKIGDNPHDRVLQLKAQGNYPEYKG